MRWGFLSGLDVGADGDPYLDRLRLAQTPWFGVYLHHIHRPDRETDLHDHPWWFASLVLTGGYIEQVWPDKTRKGCHFVRSRRRWSLKCLSRGAAHIITGTSGPLWTLVVVGPDKDEWGFWQEGRYVPWRSYVSAD